MADLGVRFGRIHPPVVTGGIVGAVIATGIRFDVFRRGLPLAVAYRSAFSGRGLLARRLDTLLASQLLTRDSFMLVSIVLSLIVMLGAYELIAGSRRAGVVAVASAVVAPVTVGLVLALGSSMRIPFAARTLSTLDYGASAITAGGGGALVAVLGRRWLRRAAVAFVLAGLLLHHQLADWEHLVAFPLGYAIATLWRRPLAAHRRATIGAPRTTHRWQWRAGGLAATVAALVAGALLASDAVAAPVTNADPPATIVAAPAPTGGSRPQVSAPPAPTTAAPLSPIRVVEARYPTPSLGGDRRVLVVLPAGYDSTTGRYPVIEMLHGRPGKPDDILAGLDLVGIMKTTPPFIAVLPDGHGPVVSDGDFADTSRQRLGAALSEDLRSWVDATYHTTGQWGVTGLSSGGYGASYLASRAQGGYRRACPMSGYFTAQDPPFKGESKPVRDLASPLLHVAATGPPTLVLVGTADAPGLKEAHAYVTAMSRVGQPNQLAILPGGHDFNLWHAALPRCIDFLLAGGQ